MEKARQRTTIIESHPARINPFFGGVIVGSCATLILGWIFIIGSTSGENSANNQIKARPVATAPAVVKPSVLIEQNGKLLFPAQLLALNRRNPSRFAERTEKATFAVKGKMAKIGEFNANLTPAGGFYVPLQFERSGYDFPEEVTDISLFIVGLNRRTVADFNSGDAITVSCPAIRVVKNSLVFDGCKLQKEAAN